MSDKLTEDENIIRSAELIISVAPEYVKRGLVALLELAQAQMDIIDRQQRTINEMGKYDQSTIRH